ncbi:MAG: VCBS repeat-containing protein, partial [Bacteroidetes bacterium]
SLSMEGPAFALADVNGDGRMDVFAGGAQAQPGGLFVQQPDGTFALVQPELWTEGAAREEVDAAFFDANGDGAPDLYVVSGGNQFAEGTDILHDQLYLNNGQGQFQRATENLPVLRTNGACVAAADYDGDGDQDLFVGSRSLPGRYGLAPQAFLLENDGQGRFADVTEARAPALRRPGMLTDAAWTDADGDGRPDLWLAGEWMPLTLARNTAAGFVLDSLPQTSGWWQQLLVLDADGDGDPDLVAGNLGLNSSLKATPETPCRLYVKDFDGNGATDPVLCYPREGKLYPWASRDELLGQMIGLRRRMPSYEAYAAMTIETLFSAEELRGAVVREVETFASVYVENAGAGRFTVRALPQAAQWAPLRALAAADLDGDGYQDLLLAGNFYGVGPKRGRYDASAGLVLQGDGTGGWWPVPATTSGWVVPGQARALGLWRDAQGRLRVWVARNDAAVLGWGEGS